MVAEEVSDVVEDLCILLHLIIIVIFVILIFIIWWIKGIWLFNLWLQDRWMEGWESPNRVKWLRLNSDNLELLFVLWNCILKHTFLFTFICRIHKDFLLLFFRYATATLKATLQPPLPPQPKWREIMDKLSEIACKTYVEKFKAHCEGEMKHILKRTLHLLYLKLSRRCA